VYNWHYAPPQESDPDDRPPPVLNLHYREEQEIITLIHHPADIVAEWRFIPNPSDEFKDYVPATVEFDLTGSVGTRFVIAWGNGQVTVVDDSMIASFTYRSAGIYIVTVTITGVGGDVVNRDFEVVVKNPSLQWSVDPSHGIIPLAVTFDVSGTTGDQIYIRPDANNRTSPDILLTGTTLDHTYTVAGVYTALMWSEINGTRFQAEPLTIIVENPVFRVEVNPTNGYAPLEVTVNMVGTTFPTFQVNWGDGTVEDYTIDDTILTHTYPSAGSYTISISSGVFTSRSFITVFEIRAALRDNVFSGFDPLTITVNAEDSFGEKIDFIPDINFPDDKETRSSVMTLDGTGRPWIFTHEYAEGDYTGKIIVYGESDDKFVEEFFTVSVRGIVADLQLTPSTGEVPFDVTIDATASVGSSCVIIIAISVDRRFTFTGDPSTWLMTALCPNPGTFDIVLQVFDDFGRSVSITKQVTGTTHLEKWEDDIIVRCVKATIVEVVDDTVGHEKAHV
jgi:PKD repeat protein